MKNKHLKGFYFSQVEKEGLGPRRKILGQIEALRCEDIDLELVESPFCRKGIIRGNFLLRQFVCRLPFTYVYSKHKYEARFNGADVFYVRFIAGDKAFLNFLKKLRKNNPDAEILMELADYPTTWYMTTSVLYTFLYFPILIKDWLAGKQYKKYVDRIIMPQKRKEAFKVPVIPFENGINVSDIVARKPVETSIINIIAVAGMCNFHGYDRLIEGLCAYYQNGGERKVIMHMVGGRIEPGNELMKYKELAEKYGLDEYIRFYGERKGKELDDIYDKCNLAVGSLGMYRIGYKVANSLKIREYLAKGLPVIVGSKVDLFENVEFPYCLQFENNDSAIDINKIVDFFDGIYADNNAAAINEIIRKFALAHCDMTKTMKPVIDYIKHSK